MLKTYSNQVYYFFEGKHMKNLIVTFCGHSDFSHNDKIITNLNKIIIDLIENSNATEFSLGAYGNFDYTCKNLLNDIKKKHLNIRTCLYMPYLNNKKFSSLKNDFDEIIFPPIEKTPKKYAILQCNRYMVQKADIVIAYVEYSFGGAAKTLAYAKSQGKRIINLAEML